MMGLVKSLILLGAGIYSLISLIIIILVKLCNIVISNFDMKSIFEMRKNIPLVGIL